jgi:NTE family protein
MKGRIDTLCVVGGGCKDVPIIGSLNVLKEKDILANVNKFAGTSAGSLIVTLLSIGYTPMEILDTAFSLPNSMVFDSYFWIPYNLFTNYGLFTGDKMLNYVRSLFIKKGLSDKITFKEHYEKTGNLIVLTGTSLTISDTLYFNCHTTPDMLVIDALRISMSIPLFFTSVRMNVNGEDHLFVDGGVLQNFPIYYFDMCELEGKYIFCSKDLKPVHKRHSKKRPDDYCDTTIGILLFYPGNTRNPLDYTKGMVNRINGIKSYLSALATTIFNKIQADNYANPITGARDNFFHNVITITVPDDVTPIDFGMSEKKKLELVELGKKSAIKFFKGRK